MMFFSTCFNCFLFLGYIFHETQACESAQRIIQIGVEINIKLGVTIILFKQDNHKCYVSFVSPCFDFDY